MKIEKVKSYNEAVSYILEIPRFSAKNDTDATKQFLKKLGECEKQTIIHVAGTNGKGSTCAFLNSVFCEMGKTTGLFTSPHLVDIRERIQIDGTMISEQAFLECTNYVIEKINEFRKEKEQYHPSFFEFIFFVAFKYFADNNVEIAIYETGLGGRLDATNSLWKKDVCVITEIGMDHMEYLGDSYEKIAFEKAGIISEGVPVVYFSKRKECDRVIAQRAEQLEVKCYAVSEKSFEILAQGEKSIDFSYKNQYDKSTIFTVNTYAHYQVENAALAIQTLEVLGFDVESSEVKRGISKMHWPGRMEKVADQIFVDGGHNVDGIDAFLKSVLTDGCKGKRYLIFSAVSDKQVDVISRMLIGSNAFERIALCEIESQRAKKLEELKTIFDILVKDIDGRVEIVTYGNVSEAYDAERGRIGVDDRLYICGSLYLIGAVKEYIEAIKND